MKKNEKFHVEHSILKTWADGKRITDLEVCETKFLEYASMILKSNKRFNLTGNQNLEQILEDLIIGSLDPLPELNIAPGSSFIDIGTGGGIPGIPAGIFLPEAKGLLVDSNMKKTDFIREAAATLGLDNIKVICSRIEDLGREKDFREKFDLLLSRGLAAPYMSLELGAPFIKKGGRIYIYSKLLPRKLTPDLLAHASELGLELQKIPDNDTPEKGLLFKKISATDVKFPRNFPIIRRESKKHNF